jgi:predicted DNA-binding transcriptional regulator AlpA
VAERNRLPSADEIAAMTPEEAEATLVAATSLLPLLVARAKEARLADGAEWITVGEAAQISGMSRFFFYDHWKEFAFCRKIGRSVKLNRRGLKQWLDTEKAA